MTSIGASTPYSIDFSRIKKLQLPEGSVRKLSEEESAKFQKIREAMYSKPTNLDELKNHISQKPYAEVKVDGKTVATLYNSGSSATSNAVGAKILGLPSMGEGEKSTGPELAQKRAQEIAKALGGTVVKSSSAVTQAQYLSTKPFEVKYEIDYEAMNAAMGRIATPQTATDAQSLAQADDTSSAALSAKDEFLKFQDMSWEEKVRALILKSMGLEEEDIDQMSAEERAKIEAKIKEKIDEEIEKKTGMKASPAGLMASAGLTS